jgi:hypothetical protein
MAYIVGDLMKTDTAHGERFDCPDQGIRHIGVDLARPGTSRTAGAFTTSSGIVREMTDTEVASCQRYLHDPAFHFMVDQMRQGIRAGWWTADDIRKAVDLALVMEDLHQMEMEARDRDAAATGA